jgi:hypothetical protein
MSPIIHQRSPRILGKGGKAAPLRKQTDHLRMLFEADGEALHTFVVRIAARPFTWLDRGKMKYTGRPGDAASKFIALTVSRSIQTRLTVRANLLTTAKRPSLHRDVTSRFQEHSGARHSVKPYSGRDCALRFWAEEKSGLIIIRSLGKAQLKCACLWRRVCRPSMLRMPADNAGGPFEADYASGTGSSSASLCHRISPSANIQDLQRGPKGLCRVLRRLCASGATADVSQMSYRTASVRRLEFGELE